MNIHFKYVLLLTVAVSMFTAVGEAASIIEDWQSTGIRSWDIEDVFGGPPAYGGLTEGALGDHTHALTITGGAAEVGRGDAISADDAGADTDFLGDYTTGGVFAGAVQGISFDFYVDSATASGGPSNLRLFFDTDYDDGSHASGGTWFLDITGVAEGWGTYGSNIDPASLASFSYGDWYSGEYSTVPDWALSLAAVTDIGIELDYLSGVGGQIYGVDNFTLDEETFMVPEPETYLVLGMALLSVAVVFRKRISESLAEARAMLMV